MKLARRTYEPDSRLLRVEYRTDGDELLYVAYELAPGVQLSDLLPQRDRRLARKATDALSAAWRWAMAASFGVLGMAW